MERIWRMNCELVEYGQMRIGRGRGYIGQLWIMATREASPEGGGREAIIEG